MDPDFDAGVEVPVAVHVLSFLKMLSADFAIYWEVMQLLGRNYLAFLIFFLKQGLFSAVSSVVLVTIKKNG